MTYVSREYDDTVQYLYGLQKHGIKLGLSNINKLMDILGEPHKRYHSIHIAGTNGKGSTATALASILIANGFKVGLFTSPHLVSFTERIQINNRRISEPEVIDLASRVRSAIRYSDLNPTFFEVVTAMALYYFSEAKVDWAVIETGMGGRLDATNIIDPHVCIITNISLDHCEFLGESLSDITYEKAGIIKYTTPVITASQSPEVIHQLSHIAGSRNAGIHIYNKDFKGTLTGMDDRYITLDYDGFKSYGGVTAHLAGAHQLYNICSAIRACEILRMKGLHIGDTSIKEGLQNIHLEGRLERISEAPPIILDSAHNPEAAKSLSDSAKSLFGGKKIILIIGTMGDKNIQGIISPLSKIAEIVILTKAKYERAASPEKLQEMISAVGMSDAPSLPESVHSTDSVNEALDLAKSLCRKDHVILVTGSFYTTGEVKEILGSTSVLSKLREYK